MPVDRGGAAGAPVSLSMLPSTRRQRLAAGLVASFLAALALAAIPHLHDEVLRVPAFVPTTVALIVVIDLITAYLLFCDAVIARSRPLAVLASGFLFTGLIAIPYGIEFPDIWLPPGVSVGSEPTAWLWFVWHIAYTVVLVVYAAMAWRERRTGPRETPINVPVWVGSTLALLAVSVVFALHAGDVFPHLQSGRYYHPYTPTPVAVAVLLCIGALLVAALVRIGAMVPLWLAISCVGVTLEAAILLTVGERYTVGWYYARVLGLLASSTVLLSLLYEMARLLGVVSDAERQARDAAAIKTRFLATMSHELRTPINAVVGMSELILGTPLTEEARDYATTVRSSAEALLNVVNDILDFSKIEAGATELERAPFSPLETVEVVADILAAAAREKNVALVTEIAADVPLHVVGDAHRLRQVLLNLAGNAVKFTERGHVVIRAAVERVIDERTVLLGFSVADTGPGIAADVVAHLFEPFRQADAGTTRRYGGTGLGLSISKRLVALMDGEIRLDTVAGVGTTFRFAIPLPRVGGASRERDRAILRGVRMLLVDTEPNARAVAERYLTRWGARVSSTPPYDVAVLAHGNGTDAYGLLAFLRETQPTLPAVFVSAYDEPGWVETARGAGFAFAVRKPLRHQALYDAVVGALTRQRVQVPAVERASVGASTGRDVAVLVVDDNAVNRKLTLQQLKRLGYGADVAENGRMAIDAVAERRFDLVLMDCEMPEVDGYTATRAIRASEATTGEHVPIVAMTANAMAGDREACLAAGMDDYLAKPVQLAELRDIVERYTGSVV